MKRISYVLGLAVLNLALMAGAAFAADHDAADQAVNTAVADLAERAVDLVVTNIPIILGVVLVWVILAYGRRLLSSI